MCQLQLSLFGVPIVKHGETTLTFSTRKALALLVYLAVEGGLHTRKTLSEIVLAGAGCRAWTRSITGDPLRAA